MAIQKTYLAIVRGITPEEGIIDHPLKEQLDKMTDQRADQKKPRQEAITPLSPSEYCRTPCEYRPLSNVPGIHSLSLTLKRVANIR